LDGAWNKDLLPHRGRHPNEYHQFVLKEMKTIDETISAVDPGNAEMFTRLFAESVIMPVKAQPAMVRKSHWLIK